jgi:PIN domain nuclease of toxin-antitoxin system
VVPAAIEPAGFSLLAIRAEHAVSVYDLGRHHPGPFDRLPIAPSQTERMRLLTRDEALAACGDSGLVIWLFATE